MYEARWSPRLRQGDVFGPIFFPLAKRGMRLVTVETSASLEGDAPDVQEAMVSGASRHAVVLSHDCEFNEGKRPFFVVGRIQSLPRDVSEERLEELRLGND